MNLATIVYCSCFRLRSRLAGLLVVLLITAAGLLGQTTGDYRTTGNTTFATNGGWERFDGSSWAAAVTAPAASDNVITVRTGHTATLTGSKTLNQLVIASGGIITINAGITLTLSDGAGIDLDVNGTFNSSGSVSIGGGATISFNSGSTYNHTRDGGVVPAAIWDPASHCNITGVTVTMPSGFGQTFGNLTWNSSGQTSNLYFQTNITILGNFTVSGTGTFDPTNRALRMSNNSNGYTIDVSGDFLITNGATFKMNNSTGSCIVNVGGNFSLVSGNLTIVTGGASSTFSIAGDFSMQAGTLIINENDPVSVGTLNVAGNFSHSGGNINTETSGWPGTINFNGNTLQTYTRTGGSYTNTINFNVPSGTILDVGTSLVDGSNGFFTLNAGAGIISAHPQGLSLSVGTGSIRVSGTRTFSSGADYTYDGSVAQVTGNALPSTVRNFTANNSAGVTLTNNVTVNGTLSLLSGALNLNGRTVVISATGLVNCAGTGTINGNAGSSFTINSTNATGFPAGTYQNATVNSAGGVTLCGSVTINGILNFSAGRINIEDYNLTIGSPGQITGASLSSYIIAENSGTLKQYVASVDKLFPVGISSLYVPITLNNSGGSADYYSVNVFATVTDNGLSSGTPVSFLEDCVKMTWRLGEDVAGGSSLDVTTQWNAANEGSTFTRNESSVGYHDGSDWTPNPLGSSAASGSNPYTQVRTDITNVGSFAVGNKCTKLGDHLPPYRHNQVKTLIL